MPELPDIVVYIDHLEASLVGQTFERVRLMNPFENHTLKRSLTDPRSFSGIGNAYSDEILHRAKLSPFAQTRSLSGEDVGRLYTAARATLVEWTERLREEAGKVLADRALSRLLKASWPRSIDELE